MPVSRHALVTGRAPRGAAPFQLATARALRPEAATRRVSRAVCFRRSRSGRPRALRGRRQGRMTAGHDETLASREETQQADRPKLVCPGSELTATTCVAHDAMHDVEPKPVPRRSALSRTARSVRDRSARRFHRRLDYLNTTNRDRARRDGDVADLRRASWHCDQVQPTWFNSPHSPHRGRWLRPSSR